MQLLNSDDLEKTFWGLKKNYYYTDKRFDVNQKIIQVLYKHTGYVLWNHLQTKFGMGRFNSWKPWRWTLQTYANPSQQFGQKELLFQF